jgi:hypothetical protein
MGTILDRCRRLKIKLDPTIERIAELQDEIHENERAQERVEEEGKSTGAYDAILSHLRFELKRLTED